MFEQLIIQLGALGIVAFVVFDQKKVTNILIKENTKFLSKNIDILNKIMKSRRC